MWIEFLKEKNEINVNFLSLPPLTSVVSQKEVENKIKIGGLAPIYLQLSEIEFKLTKLKAKSEMEGVLVPELVQRPLRFIHLN